MEIRKSERSGQTDTSFKGGTRPVWSTKGHVKTKSEKRFFLFIYLFLLEKKKTTPQSIDALVVEVPLDAVETASGFVGKLREEVTRKINGVTFAAHALVDDGTGGSLAAVFDGDGPSAVRVGHDTVRQSKDVLGVAIIGSTAGAGVGHGGSGIIVGTVTGAGRACRARAAAAAGAGAQGVGGRRSCNRGSGGRGGGGCRGRRGGFRGGSNRGGANDGGLRSRDADRWNTDNRLGSLGSWRWGPSGAGRLGGGSRGSRGSAGSGSGLSRSWGNAGSGSGLSRRRGSLGGLCRNRQRSDCGSLAWDDRGGDIDGGPDNVGDGLPHDGAVVTLLERKSRAESSEESTGQGESLGDWGHCGGLFLVYRRYEPSL